MNICIFGASSDRIDPAYFDAAFKLGVLIARGVIEHGGEAHGVAPRFFNAPGVLFFDGCSILLTETMAQRKTFMAEKADAFIALPGGIGTFEEFMEVLTLRQLGRHYKPIALLNTLGYFDALESMLREASEKGFMSARVHRCYALCPDPAAALSHVTRPNDAPDAASGLSLYSR